MHSWQAARRAPFADLFPAERDKKKVKTENKSRTKRKWDLVAEKIEIHKENENEMGLTL